MFDAAKRMASGRDISRTAYEKQAGLFGEGNRAAGLDVGTASRVGCWLMAACQRGTLELPASGVYGISQYEKYYKWCLGALLLGCHIICLGKSSGHPQGRWH